MRDTQKDSDLEMKTTASAVESVVRIESLNAHLVSGTWRYAHNHREVIADHWRMACAANPNFFNGVVHVLNGLHIEDGHATADFLATEFKDYLYWRDEGYPDEAQVRDGFGSALIRSREGYVILGRQMPGNINEGLAYLPGGFIDARDVSEDHQIDVRGSVARELAEETGLDASAVTPQHGFLVTQVAAHVSFAVPYVSPLGADDLVQRVHAHIAAESNPELAEVVVLKSPADMEGLAMAHYARVLLASSFAWSFD
ncbi:MAG: NUDIX hydrolase [Hyphomicrobiaceae bacterium]